jgi:hypothetical protein
LLQSCKEFGVFVSWIGLTSSRVVRLADHRGFYRKLQGNRILIERGQYFEAISISWVGVVLGDTGSLSPPSKIRGVDRDHHRHFVKSTEYTITHTVSQSFTGDLSAKIGTGRLV